jgi:hypothetical protein
LRVSFVSTHQFVQSMGQFICSTSQFVQSMGQFICSTSQFVQLIGQFIYLTSQFVQSMGQFICSTVCLTNQCRVTARHRSCIRGEQRGCIVYPIVHSPSRKKSENMQKDSGYPAQATHYVEKFELSTEFPVLC